MLLDACVLLPYQLADLLLRLAEVDLYEPLWSEEILSEVERNLVDKFHVPTEKASRRLTRMRSAFPNALIEGYEALTPAMTNHPKDRHVAAAAIRGGAALIVTANLGDFPSQSLSEYDIEAVHPDAFLMDQLDLAPHLTIGAVVEQRESYKRPSFSLTDFNLNLRRTVPNFADAAAAAELTGWDADEPLPLEIVSADEAGKAFFPDGEPVPTDPLRAGFLWWKALLDRDRYAVALHNLTWCPEAWGDYQQAFDWLSNAGIMQFVQECPGDDDIAYVKFLPQVDHPMVSFGAAPLKRVYILTMVRHPEGWWQAWGLSENRFPGPEEIRSPSAGDHAVSRRLRPIGALQGPPPPAEDERLT